MTADPKSPPALSVVILVTANLIPLLGVAFWEWQVFPLMVLFWLENLVIGLFNVPRMLLSGGDGLRGPKALGKVATAAFFSVHYGLFTWVHGVFVFALFAGRDSGMLDLQLAWQVIGDYQLQWALAALVASHGLSFFINYIGRGEYRTATLQQLMKAPYGRVIVLHLAILGGGFVTQMLGSPTWALLLLVALKIGLDVRAHNREHAAIKSVPP